MNISNNRSQADAECARFTGLACTWDVNTNHYRVRPEAAARAIRLAEAERKQRNGVQLWPLCQEHVLDLPFGWIASAEITDDGLFVQGYMDAVTPEARNAFRKARQGKSNGLSLGFKVLKEHLENGVRVIDDLVIVEVSVGKEPVDRGAWLKSIDPFSDLEYACMRAIAQKEHREVFMNDEERKLADLRARLLENGDEEKMKDNHMWVDDDDLYERPLYDHSPRQEPDDRGYRIDPNNPDENPVEFWKLVRSEMREGDPELYELVPGGQAQQRLIEQRKQERIAKQKAQKVALEADRKAIVDARIEPLETYTVEQLAAKSGIDTTWLKRFVKVCVDRGEVVPAVKGTLILRGCDYGLLGRRHHAEFEAAFVTAAHKRQERGR